MRLFTLIHTTYDYCVTSKGLSYYLTFIFQLFDMTEYKSHVALELQKQTIDHRKLHRLSAVCLRLELRGEVQVSPPIEALPPHCSLCVINLCALDVLANDAGHFILHIWVTS